jgi:hypothetical protein
VKTLPQKRLTIGLVARRAGVGVETYVTFMHAAEGAHEGGHGDAADHHHKEAHREAHEHPDK